MEQLQREIKLARDDARQKILGELTEEQRQKYREAYGEIADYPLR